MKGLLSIVFCILRYKNISVSTKITLLLFFVVPRWTIKFLLSKENKGGTIG